MAIESCGTLQFEMLFYPVDISSGISVHCVSGWRRVSCSIGLASDFFIGVGLHGNLRASPARVHNLQSTVLYQSVARAWPKIEVEYAINEQSISPHVISEFQKYTPCGILEHGFVRLYCKDCPAERVIGFSCKGRGFCPSCGSRRDRKAFSPVEGAATFSRL